jgi:hypothetical protein
MKWPFWAALATGCALLTGCQARQIAHDEKTFRQAVLDMYTDQAMDNLVRARCGMPFAQLAYRDIYVYDDDTLTGTASVDQTVDTKRGAAISAFLRDLTNKYSLLGTARRDKIMSLHADVVTTQNDVYDAYFAFATDPSCFVVTETKPDCPVHLMRKEGEKYYWIPLEAAPIFQQLVMKTTFMRGPETLPPPAFYEVRIVDVKDDPAGKDGGAGAAPDPVVYKILYFDNSIPNGNATMIATLDDWRKIRLELQVIEIAPDKSKPPFGEPIKFLRASWAPSRTHFDGENLRNAKARIYSHEYPPTAPIMAQDNRVLDSLDAIRANVNSIKSNQQSP